MDKNAIKKYAVWARTELITRVSQRAEKYDIAAEADANASSVNGVLLSDAEKKQRKALIEQVQQKGFDQVMEEVAYTWFNRFIALRFMEVNGYLPSHIRVFTDDNNNFKPQILAEAIHLELDGLDMDKVYEMKNNNENDELYKYLIIVQCNNLSKILPGMFQKIADYTELLFPDNILREGSVIEQMVTIIQQDNWDIHAIDEEGHEQGQIQIIGWLYQYYNSDLKDKVFSELSSNKKITKEKIPAATQLFTPDWIVRYMVDNSLGRVWKNGHPNSDFELKYYLEDSEQDDTVELECQKLKKQYENLNPANIKCIDPCCGSGHILAYVFDVFIKLYEEYGVTSADAVKSIIENNICGLDIDNRAAQLAYFSIMMKAVQYDRRFLRRKDEKGNISIPQPHVYEIKESNNIDNNLIHYFSEKFGKDNEISSVLDCLRDAKEYGSLVRISNLDFNKLSSEINIVLNEGNIYSEVVRNEVMPLIDVARALNQSYTVVVTNPPYMGSAGMATKLSEYVKKNYKDSKSDLFATFIERCIDFTDKDGYFAMITQHAWMFLSSYENLRRKINCNTIVNMAHLGPRAFEEIAGEVVQTTSFVANKKLINGFKGTYKRLVDANSQSEKEKEFFNDSNTYLSRQSDYENIPGMPIAYWAPQTLIEDFINGRKMEELLDVKQGLATGDNNRFIRLWHEVEFEKCKFDSDSKDDLLNSGKKWVPYNKGGQRRMWYGNYDFLVNWENDGNEIKHFTDDKGKLRSRPQNTDYYFKKAITWGLINTGGFCIRYRTGGGIHDVSGMSAFDKGVCDLDYLLGIMSTPVADYIFKMLNPTINLQVGDFKNFPVIIGEKSIVDKVVDLSRRCVELSKEDWDLFENSWDFKSFPLIQKKGKISEAFEALKSTVNERFTRIKVNQEEINKEVIALYGLDEILDSRVSDNAMTVHKIYESKDEIETEMKGNSYILTKRDIIESLISYAVGCIFGRYSIDKDGVVCTSAMLDVNEYESFKPDNDDIVPICDDEYFGDDIVSRFENFISVAFGSEYLEDNLKYIAYSIGDKGTPRQIIRNYFLNDFYTYHLRVYQKRPIYWLFDSGKKNAIKCLVYIHRYKPDLLARIRTEYVHEQQARFRTIISELEGRVNSAEGSAKINLKKQLDKVKEQADELHGYEEKIHHYADQMIEINLDNGVKDNYFIFNDVLAKIK